MNTSYAINDFITATDQFMDQFEAYFNIQNEVDYKKALTIIDGFMDNPKTATYERYQFIFEKIGQAITEYEGTIPELADYKREADNLPADIATLRTLMDQHHLGVKDFPEIGTKGYISKILSGDRNLTKQHIEKLVVRFHISPILFFSAE